MGRMQSELALCESRASSRGRQGNTIRNSRLACWLMTALWVFSFPAFAQEPVQTAEDPKDFVSVILPYPIEEVYARAQLLFNSDRRDYYEDYNAKIYELPEPVASYKDLSPRALRKFLRLPIVRPNKFYVFFGAYPNVQGIVRDLTPLAAMGHDNAALQRYAALPEASRTMDMYIWSPDTPYWYSEYMLGGKPLPFKSFFILHLSRVDAGHTEAEMIENEPVVRLNNVMSVDVHGTVHDYEDREVEPTTRDREFLLSCLQQFIDRGVPGRHYFSCREKGEVVETPIPFTVP